MIPKQIDVLLKYIDLMEQKSSNVVNELRSNLYSKMLWFLSEIYFKLK